MITVVKKSTAFISILFLVFLTFVLVHKNQAIRVDTANDKINKIVTIGGADFSMRVVETETERALGLSGTNSLGNRDGMLFIFPYSYQYGFWMKEMNYPLDIIWLDENHKIVTIRENLSPETYPEIFYPEKKALYVVEVSAGTVKSLSLKVGDNIYFKR